MLEDNPGPGSKNMVLDHWMVYSPGGAPVGVNGATAGAVFMGRTTHVILNNV
jgi:hypothetical protein